MIHMDGIHTDMRQSARTCGRALREYVVERGLDRLVQLDEVRVALRLVIERLVDARELHVLPLRALVLAVVGERRRVVEVEQVVLLELDGLGQPRCGVCASGDRAPCASRRAATG